MKKLLLVAMCLSVFLGAYAAEPTVAFQFQNGSSYTSIGLTSDGKNAIVSVAKKGNDAVYTVYNSDFSVDRTFTIKGGFSYSVEIAGNRYDNEASHPDYTIPAFCRDFETGETSVLAIQNLEGNNGKWYVAISNDAYEEAHDSYSVGDYITKNLSIYDETGHLVGTLTNAGYTLKYYVGLNGRRYLVTYGEADTEEFDLIGSGVNKEAPYNSTVEYFWDFSGASGVARPVVTGKRTSRAYPNPLHQGRDFTIELGETAIEGTRVVVADMNGAIIYTCPVKAGAEKVMVPGGALRYGNMVYTVVRGDELLEKGKILVR